VFSVKIIVHVSFYISRDDVPSGNRTRIRNRSPRLSASGQIEIMYVREVGKIDS